MEGLLDLTPSLTLLELGRCGVAPCAPDTLERLIGLQVCAGRRWAGESGGEGGRQEAGLVNGRCGVAPCAPDMLDRIIGLQCMEKR